MFCRKCGSQLKPEAKFCKQCGNPVASAQPQPVVPPSSPPNPQPRPTAPVASRTPAAVPAAVRTSPSAAIIVMALVAFAAVASGAYSFYSRYGITDATIASNVRAKFFRDPELVTVIVTVQNGVVYLTGFVDTETEKETAVRIANGEPGVKKVVAPQITTPSIFNAPFKNPPIQVPPGGVKSSQDSPTSPTSNNQDSPPPQPPLPVHSGAPVQDQPTVQTPPAEPAIVQAVIQQGGTSLQLPPGQMYIYGMVTGGARPTTPFASGDSAQAINAAGQLCAALAYGNNGQNSYTTGTEYHVIGGVSVSGTWDDMKAYYGSNSRAGASIVAAPFVVNEADSLVVVIASAASEKNAAVQGIPGLQVDATSSGGALPMVIGHAYMQPGNYTASETSSAVSGQDPRHMADIIGVFVFKSSH